MRARGGNRERGTETQARTKIQGRELQGENAGTKTLRRRRGYGIESEDDVQERGREMLRRRNENWNAERELGR